MMNITKEELLDMVGSFVWCVKPNNSEWFIKTNKGNFVWSDPQLGGDNNISPIENGVTPEAYFGKPCFNKGEYAIYLFCGDQFKIVLSANHSFSPCWELDWLV